MQGTVLGALYELIFVLKSNIEGALWERVLAGRWGFISATSPRQVCASEVLPSSMAGMMVGLLIGLLQNNLRKTWYIAQLRHRKRVWRQMHELLLEKVNRME